MIGSSPVSSFDDAQRLRSGTAVSWGAILAGASVAVATSAILLLLGAGLGFAAISPWENRGASAGGFAMSGAIWLIVTQWLSAGLGGYIAGRLRHRWLATHEHEVFFRDTAHGLVTWSLATMAVVFVAGATLSAAGQGAARAGGMAAGVGMPGMAMHGGGMAPSGGGEAGRGDMAMGRPEMGRPDMGRGDDNGYSVDKLFRGSMGGAGVMDARMQVAPIAAKGVASGEVSEDDRSYLSSLVADKTGISSADADKRVDAFIAQLKDANARLKSAADAARKAAANTAIYGALAMLIGAFIASVAAVIGGRIRDEHL